MGIRFEKDQGRYKIMVGDIKKAWYVDTREQVTIALDHYFGLPHDKANCAFCKSRAT